MGALFHCVFFSCHELSPSWKRLNPSRVCGLHAFEVWQTSRELWLNWLMKGAFDYWKSRAKNQPRLHQMHAKCADKGKDIRCACCIKANIKSEAGNVRLAK